MIWGLRGQSIYIKGVGWGPGVGVFSESKLFIFRFAARFFSEFVLPMSETEIVFHQRKGTKGEENNGRRQFPICVRKLYIYILGQMKMFLCTRNIRFHTALRAERTGWWREVAKMQN